MPVLAAGWNRDITPRVLYPAAPSGSRRPGACRAKAPERFDPPERRTELSTGNMKEPTREERELRCFRKRRYRTQGDALDAALVAGVERQRKAYECLYCKQWHLTTVA
jgi:hypothetical protein